MAKIKYNVKGVESKGNQALPKPGVYRCKVVSCVDAKPSGKDRRLEVQYEITEGDNKGFKLYDYINLESDAAAWKLRQFLEAVGLVTDKKETGTMDTDSIVGTALSIKTKIQPETDQYAAKAVPALLMPLDGGEEDEEDLDEDELDDDDEPELTDEEESDDEDEEASELWTEEELQELEDDDLVLYAFGGEDSDGDEVEGMLDADDQDTYTTKKKVGKKIVKKLDRDALIAAMLEAQGGEEEDEDEDEIDYEAMDLDELKKLAKTRKLSFAGSKKVIIARLQKDDQPF